MHRRPTSVKRTRKPEEETEESIVIEDKEETTETTMEAAAEEMATPTLQDIMRLLMNNKEDMKKQNEDIKKISEQINEQKEDLKKQMAEQMEGVIRQMFEQNEEVRKQFESFNQKIIEDNDRLQVQLENVWDSIKDNTENVAQLKADVVMQLSDTEELCRKQCEAVKRHTEVEITKLSEEVTGQITNINDQTGKVHERIQVTQDNVNINHHQEWEKLKKEIEQLQNRPAYQTTECRGGQKEEIKYTNYQRNPMEYIQRLSEYMERTGEKRWEIIKARIDGGFKESKDNWWDAVRHTVNNYADFVQKFKNQYWSPPIQHQVRNILANGRFDPNRKVSLSAYFLGKVCVARNLEPAIPEDCLVNQLVYHFDESIVNARSARQIETITGMTQLLGNFERDEFYRMIRFNAEPNRDVGRRNYNNYNNNNYNHQSRDQVNVTYAQGNRGYNRFRGGRSNNVYRRDYQNTQQHPPINRGYQSEPETRQQNERQELPENSQRQ